MGKLKRQVIILTLCLIAVVAAKIYVDKFISQQPPAEQQPGQ